MKLALTCYRTIGVSEEKKTKRLGGENFPLVDGVEIAVKEELITFVRDNCCPFKRKLCNNCTACSRFKIAKTFKLHYDGNKGMFTCRNSNHPSIYINGGSWWNDKLPLGIEFEIGVGTIIYLREPFGHPDDVKVEFHVVAVDDNDTEIDTVEITDHDDTVVVVAAEKGIIVDATGITAAAITAEVFLNNVSTPKSLMDNAIIATPVNSTPINMGSIAFTLPIEQHHYSPGLFSYEAKNASIRSATDPPDSTTKKLIIRKDPTGKSPKFRLQSPPPIRSPPPINIDKESWLQERRMDPSMCTSAKRMDYSTTNKFKKE